MKLIDRFIDNITMYRLVLYYLIALLLAAMGLSVAGALRYDALAIAISALISVAACWSINKALAWIFNAPINSESSLITALILALIIMPDTSKIGITFLLAAAGLAMASKYVLAINNKHLFNPAAIAVLLTALGPNQTASWWIGSSVMLPFVVIGGILLARKLRSITFLLSFFAFTILMTAGWAMINGSDVLSAIRLVALSSPMFFLGFVMLTEPLTAPSSRRMQFVYGGIVGFLLPPQAHLLNLYPSPELALIVGNMFAYLVNPKTKLFPVLREKVRIAANTADFVFTPGRKLAYKPGQYMEFTLPHTRADDRGNRRYFTLASSPTEPDIRIGVKFYSPGSSFKKALLNMTEETPIVAARVAGDFTLPKNRSEKLAFLAGGIGVTPFRSMVKYIIDTDEHRDVVLLYGARGQQDIAYQQVFETARQKFGLKAIYVLSDEPASQPQYYGNSRISADIIRAEIPDYAERTFYLSGTHEMVRALHETLRGLGVPARRIKEDFFPGYA